MCRQLRHFKRSRLASIVCLLSMSIGCTAMKQNRESDLVRPLAGTSVTDRILNRGKMPSEHSLCMETAKTVAAQGHVDEAIKLYERAQELDPKTPRLDRNLAPLYAQTGDYKNAIACYQRMIQSSPSDPELSNNFAWTLMEAGRFEQAIEEANRGLKIDTDNHRLRMTMAMSCYRAGDHNEAFGHFERVCGPAGAHHNLAILDIDSGNPDSARIHLRMADQLEHRITQTEAVSVALSNHLDNDPSETVARSISLAVGPDRPLTPAVDNED